MKKAKLSLIFIIITLPVFSQSLTPEALDQQYKISVLFGLNQPLITQGFNVELNYYTKHFVFDYSHGFNLHFKDNLVNDEAKKQHLKFKISHSLGFGIGYRITPELNLRIEPKIHLWEVSYSNQSYDEANVFKKYTTYTLGLGAYYRWLPFKNTESFARGLTVAPSIRWWPNIQTSLTNNKFEYFNTITNKTETHHANNIGVKNTPFFGNISVGYTFGSFR
jgi:hypothetical protein